MVLLGLQRLSYAPPVALSLTSDDYRRGTLNTVLVVLTFGWNAVLFRQVWRRGWFAPALVWLDVAWSAGLLLLVTTNVPRGLEHEPVNWSERMSQAAAALAGAALAPVGLAALAVAGLLAAHTAGTLATGGTAAELLSCLNGILWFAVIVGFVLRYLRRQGRALDESTRLRVAAESARAKSVARLANYRALHDTVLTTLVAIARGGLDHRTDEVRRRCAREAEYVRRLCREDAEAEPGDLGDKLTEVIAGAEALGLRIRYQRDALPADLPPEAVEGLGEAAREALNNVLRHSGTDQARVTALRTGAGVTVSVVDRGRGFDPADGPTGFGLRFSVRHRMSEIGGVAVVDSRPGEGTSVELTWPGADA
ncbi:sensor histidine kinase [Actinophytocola sp.]|uniref:sensor histidine kinase n=1 Tax=Actinophytocola sp. TaxID=1872138 RepID=UPI002D807E03|nr:ATP-binding protein [Actinophytocola sp.]HET9137794.1 ATP-binding protein [Actinophytocola sp.]